MAPDLFRCKVCRKLFPVSQMTLFENQYFCHVCLKAETLTCHCCGKRIWRDDALGDSSTPLCEYCEEYHYGHCVACGRLVKLEALRYPSDDAPGYCEACYINYIKN